MINSVKQAVLFKCVMNSSPETKHLIEEWQNDSRNFLSSVYETTQTINCNVQNHLKLI